MYERCGLQFFFRCGVQISIVRNTDLNPTHKSAWAIRWQHMRTETRFLINDSGGHNRMKTIE